MSPLRRSARLGVRGGWIEFRHGLASRSDWSYYLFTAMLTVVYLYLQRDATFQGTDLRVPVVATPGILALLVTFGLVFGVASTLVAAREDGTLLRAKATPDGLVAYVVGQLVLHTLSLLPQLLIIVVPAELLFGPIMLNGAGGWLTFAGVLGLGLLALLPLGLAVGCVMPSTQRMFSWGMLGLIGLAAISGIFVPLQALWGWLQPVAQAFPLYWFGLGLRSAFLPADAAAAELTGGWRGGTTVAVLAAWAVAGLVAAPAMLRRTARRQSGSQVEAARERATQWAQ